MNTLKQWWARFQATPPGRAWKRYGDTRGSLLAGGVSYFGFLSIFPIMALAFTVFGVLLRGHPQWLADIHRYLDQALPGFVQDPQTKKGIIPLTLPGGKTLTTVGIVGVVGLLWGGLGWLGALRDGIRAVFGLGGSPGNVVTDKLRDIGVLLLIGVAVIVSAVVAGVANGAATFAAEHVGLGQQAWLVTLIGLVVQALLNTAIVGVVLRMLTGVPLPWPGLRNGAVFGGVGLTRAAAVRHPAHPGHDEQPRVRLHRAGRRAPGVPQLHLAGPARLRGLGRERPRRRHSAGAAGFGTAQERPPRARRSMPLVGVRERSDAGLPTFGQRAADRTSVAAGAVLGAFGAVLVGTGARGLRSLLRRH